MPNQFPGDFLQDVRDIQDSAKAAQTAAGQRGPLTEASEGWILRARSTPSSAGLGANDIHIYAKGGKLWVRSAGGDEELEQVPPFPQGSSVPDPPSLTAFTAPASYNVLHSQALRDDIANLRSSLVALLTSLRDGDIILG